MVEILAYAFGIMYTPGPVNLLSLNRGLNGQLRLNFCIGVGCAMLLLFVLFGYTGTLLVSEQYQILISIAGCLYIFYLAYKIARANITISQDPEEVTKAEDTLTFRSGLLMQLLNPKAPVAILPIATVQFPAAGISGNTIMVWSVILATMAFGAPSVYMLMGKHLSRFITRPQSFRLLNSAMALLLFYVAGDIAWNHVMIKL